MAKVYIVQFEMTEAFRSAKKAAKHLRSYYLAFDWKIQYEGKYAGQLLQNLTLVEIEDLLKSSNFFSLVADGTRDEVTVRKVNLV